MDNKYLLLTTIFFPTLGVIFMALFGQSGRAMIRTVALLVTAATFFLACVLINRFPADGSNADRFAVAEIDWFGGASSGALSTFPRVQFGVGLDGLGVWLFGLSALLMVTAVLVSWNAIKERPGLFYGMLLLLETGCLGVFAARDILLFYIFFEFTLIPLFFLVGIWGSEQRRYAAIKFFLFTLAGSVLTFLGLLTIVLWDQQHSATRVMQFSIPGLTASLAEHPMPLSLQHWVFVALFAGFAIKVPLFPLHTWLPLAHVQAPTAGSVILAGVLLKIGTYGFLRFSIPMLPDASALFMPWILWLSVGGIIYGALVALVQTDIKRLIAYSSVSHLGFCMLGLFAFNAQGVEGGTLQMINHGLSTGGLFALVGMLYERYHTREISSYGGLARRAPWLTFFMLIFTFSSIGLPGMNGFAGEFLILMGMFQRAAAQAPPALQNQLMTIAVLSVSGVVLGAWYMLWLIQRVFFGPLKEPRHESTGGTVTPHDSDSHAATHSTENHDDPHGSVDLCGREIIALMPLVIFIFWIGLQPHYFLRPMAPTLQRLTAGVERPLGVPASATAESTSMNPDLAAATAR